MMATFRSRVPVNVRMKKQQQNWVSETPAASWKSVFITFMIYTCDFSTVTFPNILREKAHKTVKISEILVKCTTVQISLYLFVSCR